MCLCRLLRPCHSILRLLRHSTCSTRRRPLLRTCCRPILLLRSVIFILSWDLKTFHMSGTYVDCALCLPEVWLLGKEVCRATYLSVIQSAVETVCDCAGESDYSNVACELLCSMTAIPRRPTPRHRCRSTSRRHRSCRAWTPTGRLPCHLPRRLLLAPVRRWCVLPLLQASPMPDATSFDKQLVR
jgi:hypothetical protein